MVSQTELLSGGSGEKSASKLLLELADSVPRSCKTEVPVSLLAAKVCSQQLEAARNP